MRARRSITIPVVGTLLVSLAVAIAVVTREDCPDSRPDGPAARAAAKACGEPVDVALLTSATRLVVANPDGTMTVTQHTAPQRVRRDDGWVAVDTALDPVTVAPKAAAVDVRFAGGPQESLVTIKDDDRSLEWGPAPQEPPKVDGDTATFATTRVQALADGFRIVITGQGAQQVRMPVNTRGLALQESDGVIRALDAKHRTVFVAERATTQAGPVPTKIENGNVVFTLPDGAWELTQVVRHDQGFDGTVLAGGRIDSAKLGDENVTSTVKTAVAQQASRLPLEKRDQPLVTTFTPGTTATPVVTSTDYPADERAHGAPKQPGKVVFAAPGAVEFRHRWQGEGEFTRVPAPSGTAEVSVTPPAKGTQVLEVRAVDATGQESELAPHATRVAALPEPIVKHDNGVFTAERGTAFKYRWNTDWIFEKAVDGKAKLSLVPPTANTVEVVAIGADPSVESAPATFTTAAVGTPQVASADYPADGVEHGAAGKEGTFTFRATGTDPVTGFRHQLDGGAVTDVAGSGKAQAKITPPTAGEHVLTVKAVGANGEESPAAQHRFKVASAAPQAPAAPQVVSSDYPADGQPHGAPGQAGTFTLKSPGANGFRYRLGDGPTTTVAAAGEAQVQLTPSTSGTHTLTAWALNGQTSAPATYTFTVGGLPVPAPDAPVVTSTDFPADGQPHGSIGQAGTVTVRPQGSTAADVIVHQLDTDAASKEQPVANGAAQLSVTPVRSGKRTLTVWSKVSATGALSTPVRHEFVAGAPAGPRDFFYDAAGQLAGVANNSGEAAAYRYDDSGNLLATERFVQGDATVFAIVPARGPAGSTVEISGIGFAAQGTTVTFDGINAPVTASSGNRVSVTVPQGVREGVVRVTANGKTSVSPRPFQLARGVTAPAITAVSTDRGDAGNVVTITGTGFDPDIARNVVRFHQTVARVREVTATKLVVQVPDAASSGRITVRTPGGEATSAADFLVAPRGFVTGNLIYGGRLQVGTTTNLDIPAGKAAVVLVDGKIGEQLNLKLENNTIPVRSAMWMFTPHGGDFARRALGDPLDLFAGSKLHQDLPTFKHNGTYTIVVAPDDAAAGKVSVTLSKDLTGDKLTRDGSGVPFDIRQGQPVKEMPFTATAGEWMSFGLTDISEPGNYFNVTVVDPDGTRLTWRARLGDYIPTMVFQAKKTGTYKVIPNFDPNQLGSGRVWLSSVIDAGPLAVNGNPTSYQVLRPGQSVRMQFQGTANQPLVLGHTDNTIRENGRAAYPVSIMSEPDGQQVELREGTAETRNLRIRKTGTHNLFISGWEAVGAAKAWLSTVAEGGKLPPNASTTVRVDRPGREMWLDYDGVKDKPLTIVVRKSVPGEVVIRLYRPDGTTSVGAVSDGKLDVAALPVTGKYRIFVDPGFAVTGDLTFHMSEPADLGTLVPDAAPSNLNITVHGQKIIGKIAGTQGQRLTMGTASDRIPFLKWTVIKPDGRNLDTSGNSAFPTALGLDLTQLPVTGDYKVVIEPVDQDVQPMAGPLTVMLNSETDGGKIEYGGAAKTVTFNRPAQNGRLTFDGTLNDLPKLSIKRNIGNNGVYYTLYAPDGTVETTRRFISTEPYEFFSRLKATGTYTLVFDPANSPTGSIDVSITKRATAAPVTQIAPPTVQEPTCPQVDRRPPAAKVGAAPQGTDQPKVEEKEKPTSTPCSSSSGWRPDAANLGGVDWTTRYDPRPVRDRPLQFAVGFTGVVGTVQSTDGKPLAGVTVSARDKKATTDADGKFTLIGLTDGHVSLRVDGRTTGRSFGTFDIGVDVKQGQVLVLPHTVFLPEIDRNSVVHVPSPTITETVLTTKSIPGLEVRIPAGTVIRDADGNVATELSLTPIPIDRPPFPLPPSKVPVYFTAQPGGGYLFPQGATIIYPNYTKEAPGTRTQFWNYDPDGKGWHVYGHGTVSKDGTQIVPDSDVKFYRLTGAMTVVPGLNPAARSPRPNNTRVGDPVDPATGLLVDEQVDLVVDDIMPIEVKRTYQQGDAFVRPFGVGASFDYGVFPWAPLVDGAPTFKEFDLVQPDGSKIHYTRTSPGQDYAGAVFAADPTPTKFDGSVAVWNDAGWDVKLRDGTIYVIGEEAPLQEIRDKFGNATTITRAPAPPGTDGKVRANGPITQVTSSSGRWVRFSYDDANPAKVKSVEDNLGRRVSYTYLPTGQLESVTNTEGGVTKYTWDAKGLLKTITDPRETRFLLNEYDDKDRVKSQTAADGGVTKFEYTDVNGAITETRMIDPRDAVRRFVFNDKGQVVSDTKAYGTPFAQETITEYETNGVRVKSTTDALKRKTSYVYDAKGYVKESTVLADTPNARTQKFDRLGPNGELTKHVDDYTKETIYELTARGAVKSVTDPLGRKTLFEVNERGQVTKVTDPAGKSRITDYSGTDAVRTTDELGKVSTIGYDVIGRKVRTSDAAGVVTETAYTAKDFVASVIDGLGRTMRYEYDRNGNRTKVVDARNSETVFHYNAMDQLRAVTDPLGVTTPDAVYDRNGNLEKETDRRGVVVEHKYDPLNRRYESTYGSESKVTNTFDAGDRVRSSVDSVAGTSTIDYDDLDRVKQETTPTGSVSYAYGTTVRDRTTTVPGRPAVRHVYDAAGDLQEIQQGGTAISVVTRDRAGRTERVGAPGTGVGQTYTYDDTGRVKTITYKSGATTLGDLAYEYDATGLPIRTTGASSRTMLPEPYGPATYDNANRIKTIGGSTITYDPEGNLLSDGATTYSWNAKGELATVTGQGRSASFNYNSDGRRLGRTVSGVTTNYVYDGQNPLQEKVNGQVTANMTASGVDGFHLRESGGTTRRFLTDAVGSTVGLVDPDGAGASYTYEPFGRTYASGAGADNPYRFTGREDDGTGLYHYRDRYYSPVLQRFISEDPIGFEGGRNVHAYVDNQPTVLGDPSGNKPTNNGKNNRESCFVNSFVAGTPVLMADGSRKAIEEVRTGDQVTATDPESGKTTAREVTATIVGKGAKRLVDITVDTDGMAGTATSTLVATDGHPFWVENRGQFVEAQDIQRGDRVRTSSGELLGVTGLGIRAVADQQVYNLTVDTDHTYYVVAGDKPVLVHNARPPRQRPDPNAKGPHSTFMLGPDGKVKKYATWQEQSNPRNPAPWELEKRYDRWGPAHTNPDGTVVDTPHLNLPDGTARPPDAWEDPNAGC
ncbi:polymorphic toxin-type HINT domain-containing protein [Lentzea nigeriaca]|uniref:polymorphic toxin-type HINT domain-containing protein n=1 Tax=Lentzea nigeriaca TaxID=1128665 RepID=UPI00195B3D41|nr:polymorphic toxin-type HINT domain-containing protein [Lentzea nigeriaca]MBM7858644.1 RHS repeat-associated protein [Lentzea nigeriaca]